ncbi:MAG: hypothetical protein AMJ94_02250 [Deltaproteobacteria bacterium SM23_61]|nr:MAG: hypothetical protein AMJ94_02250 [Deltaproteobacteria bacterium SM23_61]
MAILIVVAISILIVGLGLWGVASPASLLAFARRWQSRTGFWVAFAFRLLFGGTLWWVAPSSRAPLGIQVLAAATVISGLALPLMGYSRYLSLLSWWSGLSPGFVRVWCCAALAVGIFIFWSVIG